MKRKSPVLSAFLCFTFFFAGLCVLRAQPVRDTTAAGAADEAKNPAAERPAVPAPGFTPPAFQKTGAPAAPSSGRGEDPVQVSIPLAAPPTREGPRYTLVPETLRPGEPFAVAYADNFTGLGGRDFEAVLMDSGGRRLTRARFFTFTADAGREVKAALLAVPSTARPGPMFVRIEAPGRVIEDLPLAVESRDFISEIIPLDESNTAIRTAPDPQKTEESEKLWEILTRTGSDVYAPASFFPPVTSTRRTSFFGDRRVFRYVNGSSDTSVHAGVDYGVPKGTEVRACAPGKVVFAGMRIVTGNSVIIEHLPGVYSLYYHLEKIEVEEGAVVSAATLLGLSGSTGLSTGPHLHWEIRVSGENADPDAFVARPVLDKAEILGKLER